MCSVVERAAILAQSGTIRAEHLHLDDPLHQPAANHNHHDSPDDNGERQRLLEAMKAAKWNRRQAAILLGMPYSTLRYKLKRHHLS